VGGTPLTVVSWTESFEDYDLSSRQPLTLEWDSPEEGKAQLVAHALRRRLYYRMDLASVGIGRDELGILGSVHRRAGDTDHDIYLPLRIGQKGKPARTGSYKLVMMPGVEAQEIYVTIASEEPRPRVRRLKDGEPLRYGYYPAGRAVEVPIAGPSAAGVYRIGIAATLRNGAATTVEMWFYHPRR